MSREKKKGNLWEIGIPTSFFMPVWLSNEFCFNF